jgi:hypothetical protein
MIKRMIKSHPTGWMPRQARESHGSRMIKAHPTENRMPLIGMASGLGAEAAG